MPSATIAAVAAVASAAVATAGAIQQGQAQAAQMKYQATVAEQQAAYARQLGAAQEEDFRLRQDRAMAARRAALGASGLEAGTGSPLLVSEDFAAESELQALRIRAGGEVAATRAEQEAQLYRSGAANARTASYFRAGASLLQGIGYGASGFKGGGGGSGINPGYAGLEGTGAYEAAAMGMPLGKW